MGALTALAVATGLTSSACHQQIVQPNPERVSLSTVLVNNPCTRVAFSITGNNSVTATLPGTPCGASPFKIVSGGPMTWKQNPNRLLKIPVRILNKDEVSIPAYYVPRIVLRPAARIVSNPAGTSPATMVPLNPDSTRADGTVVWLMSLPDSVFVELPGAFPPGTTTHSKTLEFTINSPTIAGVFEFDLVGERFEVADSVPAVAPDSMPAWFGHDSSWTSQKFLKRVLAVQFKAGATPAQKSAAIDSVAGRVVGGIQMPDGTDGVYFIEVPNRITLVDLVAAGQILKRQAVVDRADPYMSIAPLWRRPVDGTGWATPGDWSIDADNSADDNWWLEEVNAPLAWGCETGDPIAPVAVIESGFRTGPFISNVLGFFPPAASPDPEDRAGHGAAVATILADRGSDTAAGTGILWRAGLRLTALGIEPGQGTVPRLRRAIQNAALSGAKVVNVSWGPAFSASSFLDSVSADVWRSEMYTALNNLPPNQRPLLVLAAGNERRDVAAAGLDSVRTSFPNNVIIVGASGRRNGTLRDRWGGATFAPVMDEGGSNFGSLIDVYAPGEDVRFWDDSADQFVARTGTSLSAPIVTGVVGLLLSRDTTLTPAELKQAIMEAATERGIQMVNHPGKYLLDAYGALRKIAQRPNSPLCGNRVWVQNTRSIMVDRVTSIQNIYNALSPDTVGVPLVRHGGRRIDFQILQQGGPYTGLSWNSGGWTIVPPASLNDSLWSGTTWSFFRRTHDGDSVVGPPITVFGGTAGASSASFVVTLGTSSQSGRTLANMSFPLVAPTFVSGRRNAQVDSAGNFIQYVESTAPGDQIFNSSFQTGSVQALPSPFGDRVLVVFNYRENPVGAPTAWAPGALATPIGNEWSYQQRFAQHNTVSGDLEVWSIPWAGGTPQPLWERPGRTIGWIGLAESPSTGLHEAVLGIGPIDVNAAAPFVGGYTACEVEYVNVLTGGSIRSRIAPPVTCAVGQIETGTIAPLRAAATQRKRN